MFNSIAPFYDPLKIMEEYEAGFGPEMSRAQLGFLCGLIQQKKPKKVLEVGVAEGGTTGVILNALQMNGGGKVYSVDLAEQYYRDKRRPVGFLLENIRDRFPDVEHRLYLGGTVAEYLETIGREIDFLILDTAHALPGELLDFLVCFPYLCQGATVVLHDTMYGINGAKPCFSNSLVFAAAKSSEKYVQWIGSGETSKLDNIGAFVVTDDTARHIEDLFFSTLIPWNYYSQAQLEMYRKSIVFNYDRDLLEVFDLAVRLQLVARVKQQIRDIFAADFDRLEVQWRQTKKKVVIYGAGKFGELLYSYASNTGLRVDAFAVSDDRSSQVDNKHGVPVYRFGQLPYSASECICLVAILDNDERNKVTCFLSDLGFTVLTMA